jgi:hypothetical protein
MAKFIHTKNSRVSKDAPSAKAFSWLHAAIDSGVDLTDKVEVRHAGKCGHCGRKLTVPESVDTGIGPDCAKKLGIEWTTTGAGLSFDLKTFIYAGNATFTVTSVKTGARFTFKVSRKKDDPEAPLFVALLGGPDNVSDYRYMGIIVGVPVPEYMEAEAEAKEEAFLDLHFDETTGDN